MSDVNRTLTSLLLFHTICRHFWRIVVIEVSYILECPDGTDRHRLFQADERRTDDPAAGVQQILHVEAPHKGRDAGQAQTLIICPASHRRNAAAAGRRTYTISSSASLRWVAKTVNCHAHPRILLPQNRCLPEPLAAPFPHQPEPRCNTLDFAGKVVCQRDAASRLSARSGASKCAAF